MGKECQHLTKLVDTDYRTGRLTDQIMVPEQEPVLTSDRSARRLVPGKFAPTSGDFGKISVWQISDLG